MEKSDTLDDLMAFFESLPSKVKKSIEDDLMAFAATEMGIQGILSDASPKTQQLFHKVIEQWGKDKSKLFAAANRQAKRDFKSVMEKEESTLEEVRAAYKRLQDADKDASKAKNAKLTEPRKNNTIRAQQHYDAILNDKQFLAKLQSKGTPEKQHAFVVGKATKRMQEENGGSVKEPHRSTVERYLKGYGLDEKPSKPR